MGLIHSRASKQKNKQEAKLLKEQREQLHDEAVADEPWWRQRTVGQALSTAIRQTRESRENTPS